MQSFVQAAACSFKSSIQLFMEQKNFVRKALHKNRNFLKLSCLARRKNLNGFRFSRQSKFKKWELVLNFTVAQSQQILSKIPAMHY